MPTEKIERIFWKNQMVDIADFETELLQWMINKKIYSHKIRKYIQLELLARVNKISVQDIPDDNKLYYSKLKQIGNNQELQEIIQKIEAEQKHLTTYSHQLDYFEIDRIQKRILALKKKKRKLSLEKTNPRTTFTLPLL